MTPTPIVTPPVEPSPVVDPVLDPAVAADEKRKQIAVLEAEIHALEAPPLQFYPKTVYRREASGAIQAHTVQTHVEHETLGGGWYESPADAKPAAVPDLSQDDAAIAADQRALDAAHAQRAADAAQR